MKLGDEDKREVGSMYGKVNLPIPLKLSKLASEARINETDGCTRTRA